MLYTRFTTVFKLQLIILSWGFMSFIAHGQTTAISSEFVFGKEDVENSKISLVSKLSYTNDLGYGFDFNTFSKVTFNDDGFISLNPVYFSVQLPEGNYKVTVALGSKAYASKTTIKAESRRLMLNQIEVAKSKEQTLSFIVNVRIPKINDSTSIQIKDREINYLNWDDKLTLEFLGKSAVKSIAIESVDVTNIFLAGDSTMTDQDLEPWASWGQFFTAYINQKASVSNYAASGASLHSFKGRNRWEKIIHLLQPNDYVFIGFAHNDQKRKGEGIGAWESYTNLLTEFVNEIKERGGKPIILTPVQRRFFIKSGRLKPTHGDYPNAIRALTEKLKLPLIDLTKMTTVLYESWGDSISRKAFVQYPAHTFSGQDKVLEDNTHFNSFGANEIALCVLKGLLELETGIETFIVNPNLNYYPNNPNKIENWKTPMSNRFEPVKPDGN